MLLKNPIFLIIIFVFLPVVLLAQQANVQKKIIPVSNKLDSGPDKTMQRIQEIKSIPTNQQKPEHTSQNKEYTFYIRTTLGDNRFLYGDLPLNAPEKIGIKHSKDGIQYERELNLKQLKSIEILTWKGMEVSQKKDGTLYRFSADHFRLTLKDGSVLETNSAVFGFLDQFPVFNENGKVYLFSYWLDLQKIDGTWYTGLAGPSHIRRICYKDVVQKIEFLDAKKDSQNKIDHK